jgi:hypothetical protein
VAGTTLAGWDPGSLSTPELVHLCKMLSGRTWKLFSYRVLVRSPETVRAWLSGRHQPPAYLRETLERIARRANEEGRVAALLPLVAEKSQRGKQGVELDEPTPPVGGAGGEA